MIVAPHPVSRATEAEAISDFLTLCCAEPASLMLEGEAGIGAIYDDLDGVAEPITELGKQHHAWVRERGLPSALDHHDHR